MAFVPGSFGTWVLSGLLVLFGGLGTFFGAVMLYFARKPIAMPVILSKEEAASDAPNPAPDLTNRLQFSIL
jgi:hypothetical protein